MQQFHSAFFIKVMKRKVEEIDVELATDSTNVHFQIEKEFIEEICYKHVHGGADEEASVFLLVSFININQSNLLVLNRVHFIPKIVFLAAAPQRIASSSIYTFHVVLL